MKIQEVRHILCLMIYLALAILRQGNSLQITQINFQWFNKCHRVKSAVKLKFLQFGFSNSPYKVLG